MRPMRVIDPQVHDIGGQADPLIADTLMLAPPGTSFTGVVYVADTPIATATAIASASKYEIVEIIPVGLVPGGTHLRVSLRRLR